jgi:histidyl-tRNA synthetase
MGDVVVAELINAVPAAKAQMEKAIAAQHELDIYIVIAKEERRDDALAQIQSLRERGYRVDCPLAPAKVGKQFQTAEQLGARVAILFGDEWPQIKLKDLRTGDQSLVAEQEVAAKVAALLSA